MSLQRELSQISRTITTTRNSIVHLTGLSEEKEPEGVFGIIPRETKTSGNFGNVSQDIYPEDKATGGESEKTHYQNSS